MKIKNLKLKIIFMGSSKFVIPTLEVLRKNFDLKLVLTTENPKIQKSNLSLQGLALPGSGQYPALQPPQPPVISYCIQHKIPYLAVSKLSDQNLKSLILNFKSPIAVLADFGLIIPKEILNAFPKGIINIHPSLLPKYRGPTPVQTAILNGEKNTGVSIMKLDEEVDHGPILGQEKEEISTDDTAESLYKRLFEKGANLLLKVLNNYLTCNLKLTAQDHKDATFTDHLTRQDGYLDISNTSTVVTRIERMIRAYYPWPGVWTKLQVQSPASTQGGEKLKVVKFLPGKKVQVEGKKPMSYKDFANGYPKIGKETLAKLGLN